MTAEKHVHTWEVFGATVAYASDANHGYDLLWCRSCGVYGHRGPTYYACGIRPRRTRARVEELQREADAASAAMYAAHKEAHPKPVATT